MSQAAAAASVGVIGVADVAHSAPIAPPHSAPDRPELDFPAQPLVISAAWWILILIAVIQALGQ